MKYYRLLNKYSCKEIADKLQTDSSSITRYENGQRHVPEDVINIYCQEFGITPNELYGYSTTKSKYQIPLYQAIIQSKTPVGLDIHTNKTINITPQEYKKGYSFAIQAWNMDNSPKIFTGDLLFFKEITTEIINKDCILYLGKNNIPMLKIYNKKGNNIKLDNFNYKVSKNFYNKESFRKIKVLGRLVEVRSYLKKGGLPWPNGK